VTERPPDGIRDQFDHEPLWCSTCEVPVTVTQTDDGERRYECWCHVIEPAEGLPDDWS